MANAVPPFDVLNRNYPNFVSVETVKRLIGGALNDLDAPPNQQWLGGANGNTCTIRLSRTLNYSGVRFREPPGMRTAVGGRPSQLRVRHAGDARLARRPFRRADHRPVGRPADFARCVQWQERIIAFDIHFTDANGHLDLWDGHTFYDEVYGLSHAGHDFFDMARRVSLWVTEGSSVNQRPPDA